MDIVEDIATDALRFHLSRRTSVAFLTLHISGYLAGRKGKSKNPFAAGGICAHEWETARAAGSVTRAQIQASTR
jgi:hypothetical protein